MRTRYRGLLRTARDIAQGLEHLHCSGGVHGVGAAAAPAHASRFLCVLGGGVAALLLEGAWVRLPPLGALVRVGCLRCHSWV